MIRDLSGWRVVGLAFALLSGSVVAARAQSATASIDGLLLDPSRAALPGVTVVLVHAATGFTRTIVTDDGGFFRAPLLPVGAYDLTATLAGFAPLAHRVELRLGVTASLRLQMAMAGVSEEVIVEGNLPGVDRRQSSLSATVNETAVHNLPVNGRNFIDFVLLTPAVSRDVRSGELSFAGQRGTLNSLIVDGADNNNTFAGQALGRVGSGRAPYQFSLDAVEEFQVNAIAYSAEFGRAAGGVINVVTKSGTNAFRGSVFEYYRDRAMNATNAIDRLNGSPKSPYHYHQFGVTHGGPLRRNRDFYFFNYDGQRNTAANHVFLNLPTNTPGDPETQAGIERLRPLATTWSRRLDQDVVLMKSDHVFPGGQRLSFRYNHQNFTGEGYENGGPQNAFEHSGSSLVQTRTLNGTWASVLRRRLFNELRLQYGRDHEPGTANSDKPEAIVMQGAPVLFIGRNNFSPRVNTINRIQFADSLTWTHGAHDWKAGLDLQFDRIHNFFPGFFSGSYTFHSLASFARGRPDGPTELYRQSFPVPGTSGGETRPSLQEYSLFVQDQWRPRPDVTLGLGLRYDVMNVDGPSARNLDPQLAAAGIDTSRFPIDANNVGPRLGITWSPGGRRFVLGGGLGFFYGRTPAILATAASSNNGVNVVSLTFTGQAVPTYPESFNGIPAGGTQTRPNLVYVDEDFANPRLLHVNASVKWELTQEMSLLVNYIRVDGTDLPRSIDRNFGSPETRMFFIADTGQTMPYPGFGANRPFSNFERVVAFESTAESRYHGMTIELNRRIHNDLQLRAAYTFGNVQDTVPDATATLPGNASDDAKFASNPVDFEVDRTFGNNDQRHRMVLSGVYATNRLARQLDGVARALLGGWTLSGIFVAQSGLPYSARVNADLNGDGNARNDLAPGTRRNSFRLPAVVTFDPRVAREVAVIGRVRAQLICEAFNVFNRDNINAVIPAYYSLSGTSLTPTGTFGRPLSSAGERIVQLVVKLTF